MILQLLCINWCLHLVEQGCGRAVRVKLEGRLVAHGVDHSRKVLLILLASSEVPCLDWCINDEYGQVRSIKAALERSGIEYTTWIARLLHFQFPRSSLFTACVVRRWYDQERRRTWRPYLTCTSENVQIQ